MKHNPKKKTFRRYVVITGAKQDFGLGVGVIARDEITFTAKRPAKFKSVLFLAEFNAECEKMINKTVQVLTQEKKGRMKWHQDPQSELKAVKLQPDWFNS